MEVFQRSGKNAIFSKDVENVVTQVSNWLKPKANTSPKCGLLLNGTVGSGKTTLAKAIIRLIRLIRLIENNTVNISSFTAEQLVELKLFPEKSEGAVFEKVRRTPNLFIDDLGCEPNVIKSWGNELTPIADIMQYRYENQLFTIVTTNLDDVTIKEMYGERIADRFNEMFDKVAFINPSFRK